MDKSSVTCTSGSDWWLSRTTMGGKERYPKQIRVGDLDRPRVYYSIDRDALLELAGEMDAVKGFEPPYKPHTYPSRFVRVELLHGYARRIREALGVEP